MHLAITRTNNLFLETTVTKVVLLGSKDNTRYNVPEPGSSQVVTLPEQKE